MPMHVVLEWWCECYRWIVLWVEPCGMRQCRILPGLHYGTIQHQWNSCRGGRWGDSSGDDTGGRMVYDSRTWKVLLDQLLWREGCCGLTTTVYFCRDSAGRMSLYSSRAPSQYTIPHYMSTGISYHHACYSMNCSVPILWTGHIVGIHTGRSAE